MNPNLYDVKRLEILCMSLNPSDVKRLVIHRMTHNRFEDRRLETGTMSAVSGRARPFTLRAQAKPSTCVDSVQVIEVYAPRIRERQHFPFVLKGLAKLKYRAIEPVGQTIHYAETVQEMLR